ncbi:MAG TPA: pyrimidine 5'-nucleotidase [Anaerolineae bacterium]|nr:pyrimidine 5'-nucleotidase [Anaerolineae bacterium]
MIRAILFDLDDTLYPSSSGVMDQIRALMMRYLCTRLALSPEDANVLRRNYFLTYGTTMRGLQVNHDIDPDEFLAFVHDIRLEDHLQPNEELGAVLAGIRQKKVVFTNASREHAEAVLAILGVRSHFDRVVDVRDMDYESKPLASAYGRICKLLALEPRECVLVEDNVRNLEPARKLGMVTVLIAPSAAVAEGQNPAPEIVDHVLSRVEEIGRLLERMEAAGEQPPAPAV